MLQSLQQLIQQEQGESSHNAGRIITETPSRDIQITIQKEPPPSSHDAGQNTPFEKVRDNDENDDKDENDDNDDNDSGIGEDENVAKTKPCGSITEHLRRMMHTQNT